VQVQGLGFQEMASIKEEMDRANEAAVSALQTYELSQPLQAVSVRCYFLREISGADITKINFDLLQKTDSGYEAFFGRYALLCKLAANRHREVQNVTHWQMTRIILKLQGQVWDKSTIIDESVHVLEETLLADYGRQDLFDICNILVELAASVWLMLSIGDFPGDISYDETIEWGWLQKLRAYDGEDALLSKLFPSKYQSEDLVKLPQTFTAAHLEQIGGIEVIWTSNLADHLLLKDDDTRLMLFHQVSILQLHQNSWSSVLPKALVDDTIRSISLLIPPILGEPNPWFKQQQRKHRIDASAGICDRLNSSERQIDKFSYWRDRLVLLKRTFDDAEPRNISQLWWDDRSKTQWFTFWVAVLVFIMTVFFGVIQSVAGIVQAWASVQSLRSQSTPAPSP